MMTHITKNSLKSISHPAHLKFKLATLYNINNNSFVPMKHLDGTQKVWYNNNYCYENKSHYCMEDKQGVLNDNMAGTSTIRAVSMGSLFP